MKVGGGLNYVVGPMGSGKSLYAVRRICDAVTSGRYVVTNVELLPGSFERIAAHVSPWKRGAARRELAQRFSRYYAYETDLHQALRYRLDGKGEGRGLFVWDEGHNDLNNRNWRDDGRETILEWATQLRKLGFIGFLLSQHQDNTDAALRRVCNYVIRLQNQREQTRLLGMRVTPWPLFLACWYPAHVPLNAGRMVPPARVERYFLGWQRHLYDTHGLYHALAADESELGVIWLGRDSAGRGAAPEGAAPGGGRGAQDETAPTTAQPGPGLSA
jgi:hypothetical protein